MAIARVTYRTFKTVRGMLFFMAGAIVVFATVLTPRFFGSPTGQQAGQNTTPGHGTGIAEADAPIVYSQSTYYSESGYYDQSGYYNQGYYGDGGGGGDSGGTGDSGGDSGGGGGDAGGNDDGGF